MTCAASIAALCALALAGSAPGAAASRTAIVYDEAAPARRILFGTPAHPGLAGIPYVLHQGPAGGLLPPERRAGKLTSFAATPHTPTIIGLDYLELLALMREAIAHSPSHTIFLDELTADFRAQTGAIVRRVLETLSEEPSPWGEESLARHIHLYVPTPSWMLHDPEGWFDAWRLLARSGGVWLETFRARDGVPVPWRPEEWLTFPAAVAERLAAAGGDARRLHLLIGPGPQPAVWRLAATGRNCALLANGPGAYRLGQHADAFVREFRRAFGPSGVDEPACAPSSRPAQRRLRALERTLALGEGAPTPPGALALDGPLLASRQAQLVARLGRDPLGIARHLGQRTEQFWRRARPRLRISGAGVSVTVRLPTAGRVIVPLLPRDTGGIEVQLLLNGAAVRRALDGPADLAGELAARSTAIGRAWTDLLASPATWNLAVPLRVPGRSRTRTTFEVGSR